MKKIILFTLVCFAYTLLLSQDSTYRIDKVKFFKNDTAIDATLTTDMAKLIRSKSKPIPLPAVFSLRSSDSLITEQIQVIARGNIRKEICYMPPLKLDFHNSTSPQLYTLNSLKLVCACKTNNDYDQLLLKEYLVYKIYNILTDKSFRVRLLNMHFEDSKKNKEPIMQHAFLIESNKALAKRNDCLELKNIQMPTENSDRNQMTLVAIFEYMIGNTDWSVRGNHNIVLLKPASDSAVHPFVVPYDFDYSGLVDADYAVPTEGLNNETVRERLYRGYPRTMDELNNTISIFTNNKDRIYSLVNNFSLLTEKNRKNIINYLDDFYKTISNKNNVKSIFINGARVP